MNVLYLTNNAGRASTTIATRGWFENLMPRGLRPVLVSPVMGEFSSWAEERQIPAHQLPLPFPNKKWPWQFARSLWSLHKLVAKHDVNLIHANEENVYPIAQCLAKICRVPLTATCHFTLNTGFARWAFAGMRRPERIFFVSRRSMDACRPALDGVVSEDRCRVLHNGLNLVDYVPDPERRCRFRQEHGIADDAILIGAACAFRERKQLEHLFEAAAQLQKATVVLAGFPVDDEAEYGRSLLQRAQDMLGARLKYVGCLTEMRGFCNALDLFVNTSREESFGMSVLESLACGCPVVGYDSKAVDEVVLPDGGEIVEQDCIDDLTTAISRWIQDPEWLRAQRPNARRQAERFDLKTLSNQLWDEYCAVLEGWKRKPLKAASL